MKIKVELDKESQRKMRQLVESSRKVVGMQAREAVAIIGFHTGVKLASRIQPFGFKRMEKSEASVGKQVWRAVKNAQIEGDATSASHAHNSRRNKKGQVPKTLKTTGQYKQSPLPASQVMAQAEYAQKRVGIAKASWIESANNIGIGNFSVPPIIQRHIGKGNGISHFSFSLINPTLVMTSRIPYMRSLIKNGVIAGALKNGRVSAMKYMEKNLKKAMRQLERNQNKSQSEYEKFNKRAARLHALKISI
jgi:hypothetical protein